jgi:hypothetical protein
MAEWRDILDRAADNLSIDPRSQGTMRQAAGWPAHQGGAVPFMASRDLLARELEAAPGTHFQTNRRTYPASAPGRASLMQAVVVRPAQAESRPAAKKAKKGGVGRELATLLISAGIVAMAVYGIFALLH